MNDQTHPVPDAVREFVFESGRGEFTTASGVDVTGRHAGTHQGDPRFARATHGIMSHEHVVEIRSTHDEGSRHVGVVAVDECTEIHHHGIARRDEPVGRLVMRQCGVRPARHDGGETDVVGTVPTHRGVEFVPEIAFRDPAEEQMPDFGEGPVGDLSGATDALDFCRGLRSPQFGERGRHVEEVVTTHTEAELAGDRDEAVEFRQRDVGGLESPLLAATEQTDHDPTHVDRALADDDRDLDTTLLRFVRRLLGVSAIGYE